MSMRRYSYQISYLDKGRYTRVVSGMVLATTIRTASQRAMSQARGKGKGWRETEGTQFVLDIIVGPKVAG